MTSEWEITLIGQAKKSDKALSKAAFASFIALLIAQTNISQMELGKRTIGKNLAKKLAAFFKTDYRLFL